MNGAKTVACWILAVGSALALAGCGQGGNSADYQAAFDKGFNQTFDKSTHDSCVSSATTHGATPDVAETYCSCVVTQLDKLSVDQRMKLQPSSPELQTAAEACKPQAPS